MGRGMELAPAFRQPPRTPRIARFRNGESPSMRVDFVVPGFSKCGTTTLCDLLHEHPDLFICATKEPNFFSYRWEEGWEWYEDKYKASKPHQFCGDGSTTYSSFKYCTMARDRILDHNPDTKFIFVARNPITRLESSYREMHHNGHKFGVVPPYDLGKTLDRYPNMLDDTRYWTLINTYRERVPDERILVLFLEDIEADPDAVIARCFEFLGVDSTISLPRIGRRLNTAAMKTYDSWMMRAMRHNTWTSKICKSRYWNRYSSKWLVRSGLRRPFVRPITWSRLARELLHREVVGEARQFLAFYDKPENFWDMNPEASHAAPRAA